MHVGVVKEISPFEERVAASPETVKKLIQLGCQVFVEKGAGITSLFSDDNYEKMGATITPTANDVYNKVDVLFCVQPHEELKKLKEKTILIGMLNPYKNHKLLSSLADLGVQSFVLEQIPRITRAQSMDVLSSQSNLAGYRAVIEGMYALNLSMPMMMTAAGSIKPAKVVILGAGVAGLQAIATAKRMGARVFAFDVRPAAKEQVMSLGATFIEVDSIKTNETETKGGYAKEMDDAYKKRQQAKIAEELKNADLVITTALLPGKPAPLLVTKQIVESMKNGAVIVDMAIENGGNCAVSQLNKTIELNGVKILGIPNLPSKMSFDASSLYARNIYNFFDLIWDKNKKLLNTNVDDEIVKSARFLSTASASSPNEPSGREKKANATTSPKTKKTTTKRR